MTKKELEEKLTAGSCLLKLFDFSDGQDCLIYKKENFEVSDEIIYIPDIFLNEEDLTDTSTPKGIQCAISHCYTGKDFVEECKGHEDLARVLFGFVDWQHLNIQDVLECYRDDEFEEEFGFSMDELQ